VGKDPLSKCAKDNGIATWNELTQFISNLPYGRNANRHDLQLLFSEKKGTCSSKHALLKSIADANDIPNVELILGIYNMNECNTPKIGSALRDTGLTSIPEAHCYLRVNNQRIDYTSSHADIRNLESDIIEEVTIAPKQVNTYKVEYHKAYLRTWICDNNMTLTFDLVWDIREKCIENLVGS